MIDEGCLSAHCVKILFDMDPAMVPVRSFPALLTTLDSDDLAIATSHLAKRIARSSFEAKILIETILMLPRECRQNPDVLKALLSLYDETTDKPALSN